MHLLQQVSNFLITRLFFALHFIKITSNIFKRFSYLLFSSNLLGKNLCSLSIVYLFLFLKQHCL